MKGARARRARRTGLASWPPDFGRHQRQQCRVFARTAPAADRAARVQVDGARPRRYDDCCVPRSEPGTQLAGVHRRPARLCCSRAEFRLRGRGRPHRLLRARAHPDSRGRQRRLATRKAGPAPRVDGLDSVRGAAASLDPPDHFIVTANHRPVPAGVSVPRSAASGPEPYRAKRIIDLLQQKRGFTPDDFARIQAGHGVAAREELLPLLFSRTSVPKDARDRQAVAMLRAVEPRCARRQRGRRRFSRRGSTSCSRQSCWRRARADRLGELRRARPQLVCRALSGADLSTPDNPWCDDVRTSPKETCDGRVTARAHDGLTRLTALLGERHDALALGCRPQRPCFAHPSLDSRGRARRHVQADGATWWRLEHGDVGPVFAPKPFEQHSLPGYRQIVDLSPANDSRFLEAVGQSGNVFSPHFDDALASWGGAGQNNAARAERDRARRRGTPAAHAVAVASAFRWDGNHLAFKTAGRPLVPRSDIAEPEKRVIPACVRRLIEAVLSASENMVSAKSNSTQGLDRPSQNPHRAL